GDDDIEQIAKFVREGALGFRWLLALRTVVVVDLARHLAHFLRQPRELRQRLPVPPVRANPGVHRLLCRRDRQWLCLHMAYSLPPPERKGDSNRTSVTDPASQEKPGRHAWVPLSHAE